MKIVSQMQNKVLLLRISYWAGAILDALALLMMLVPTLFAWNNQLRDFNPGIEYSYAMGVGAPLMFAWTILLLWADRRPFDRKDILIITLLVVLGEVATEIFGVMTGFISINAMTLTWVIQFIMSVLFIFSYWNASK